MAIILKSFPQLWLFVQDEASQISGSDGVDHFKTLPATKCRRHNSQKALGNLQLLNKKAFSPQRKKMAGAFSPGRLEWMLANNLVICCSCCCYFMELAFLNFSKS